MNADKNSEINADKKLSTLFLKILDKTVVLVYHYIGNKNRME